MPYGKSEGRGWGRDKAVFARNLAAVMEARGIDLEGLIERSGVVRRTLRRWLMEGTERPEVVPAVKVAEVLQIGEYERLYNPDLDPTETVAAPETPNEAEPAVFSAASPQDFMTNIMRNEHVGSLWAAGRFRHWQVEDVEELAGTVAVGGALTREGVERMARDIEENRALMGEFRRLLYTHHRQQLAELVHRLYAQSRLLPLSIDPSAPAAS